jgi:sugar lactone lactonase YvrE
MHRWVAAAALLGLGACGGSSSGSGDGAAAAVDPATLCVSSSCGVKTKLLDIPNAENTLFTADGRLFVSGSSNVYEVSHDAAGWHATPIYDGSCNFTGMAQRGQVLYAACFDQRLYAAALGAGTPALQPIYSFAAVSAPNGVTTGPDGELYIADGPISGSGLPTPKIARLEFDPADPLKVTQESSWLSQGVGLPNGLTRRDRTLYFSDSSVLPPALGQLRSVEIQADGSAGAPQTLSTFEAVIPDDVSLAGGDLLLALYSAGAVALIGPDGSVVSRTDPLSFQLPSSAKLGRPPLFGPTDLVVTEKGVVQVPQTGALFGNALSVFRRKSD